MAAAQGYIGRNPADSSTVIARQSFSPTGIQTDFTFAAGYEVGYVDLYLNGARLVEGQDFTATDGSTVGLTTNAVNGDVLEVVAFKAFNASNVSAAAGNFTVGGTLDVTGATTLNAALSVSGNTTVGTGITLDTNGNVNVSGVLTANSFVGDGTQLTGVGGGSVISGITIREEGSVVGTSGTVVNVNFVGPDVTATAQAGFSTITIAAGGKFINFTDGGSTGITTTAKTKIQNDFNVTGVGTFASRVSVGDSIFHVGDDNTAIGFPAADTFTVYTAGSEALRIDSSGSVIIGDTDTDNANAIANDLVIGNTSSGKRSGITIVSATDGDGSIFFSDGTGSNELKGQIVYNQTADAMRFYTANTLRLEIDSSGFLTQEFTSNNSSVAEGLFINNQQNTTGNNASIIFSNDSGERKKAAVALVDTGDYGSGDLVFALDGADSGALNLLNDEKVRITNQGNVGIGTTIPNNYNNYHTLTINGTNGGEIDFEVNSTLQADIFANGSGYHLTTRVNDLPIIFHTTNSGGTHQERMRVDGSGKIGINTADPQNTLDIQGSSHDKILIGTTGTAHATGLQITHAKFNAAEQMWQLQTDGSADGNLKIRNATKSTDTLFLDADTDKVTFIADVSITGVATATQFDATSDVALKENIEIIDEPITKLSELKGVTFDWKKGGHSVGVIAQDVEKVLPTAVGGSKDQKTVNYNAIIGLLVESVKDQQKQIEELKSLLDK